MQIKSVISAVVAAALLAACTSDEIAANEAKAAQVLASIRQGAIVAASAIKQAIDGVCANGGTVNASVQAVTGALATQSGPNTTQNINAANRALSALNGVCAQAAANPNDPAIASLLRTAWSAYLAAKTAQNNAASSASKGT
jgi:hypothetical protein